MTLQTHPPTRATGGRRGQRERDSATGLPDRRALRSPHWYCSVVLCRGPWHRACGSALIALCGETMMHRVVGAGVLVLLLAATAASSSAAAAAAEAALPQQLPTFEEWKGKYGKTYASAEEEAHARSVWEENRVRVEASWSGDGEGSGAARLGLNAFADLTEEEFRKLRLMPREEAAARESGQRNESTTMQKGTVPDSWDWTEHNAVTSVKDQGSVGTCWAFSAVGNMEGQWALNGGSDELVSLSPEFLVDCDGDYDAETGQACCSVFGGWPWCADTFTIDFGGMPTEESYPYCAGTGRDPCYPCMEGPVQYCGLPPSYCDPTVNDQCPDADKHATFSSWDQLSKDEDVLMQQLYEIGPLSAAMDATQLQLYDSGVWTGGQGSPLVQCGKTTLDHAILIVGMGTDEESGLDYWKVKNSWGEDWGEDGYFRIQRGVGMCGINTDVTTIYV